MFNQNQIVWCNIKNRGWWPCKIFEVIQCFYIDQQFYLYELEMFPLKKYKDERIKSQQKNIKKFKDFDLQILKKSMKNGYQQAKKQFEKQNLVIQQIGKDANNNLVKQSLQLPKYCKDQQKKGLIQIEKQAELIQKIQIKQKKIQLDQKIQYKEVKASDKILIQPNESNIIQQNNLTPSKNQKQIQNQVQTNKLSSKQNQKSFICDQSQIKITQSHNLNVIRQVINNGQCKRQQSKNDSKFELNTVTKQSIIQTLYKLIKNKYNLQKNISQDYSIQLQTIVRNNSATLIAYKRSIRRLLLSLKTNKQKSIDNYISLCRINFFHRKELQISFCFQ